MAAVVRSKVVVRLKQRPRPKHSRLVDHVNVPQCECIGIGKAQNHHSTSSEAGLELHSAHKDQQVSIHFDLD